MAQLKGKDFETLGGRVPKELAEAIKKHAQSRGKNLTEAYVEAIQQYLASPMARLAILETEVHALQYQVQALKRHVGERTFRSIQKSIEERLAELTASTSKERQITT
ncbi:MAG: hypothetical protein FJ280_23450 [Planctomycetes bacterium]|nr:hypothetical protein [Deltaproteobacteria bacterium]MBM4028321.1 hypothetical protein [Planctomycetota bacterium]